MIYPQPPRSQSPLPPAVLGLIATNVIFYMMQQSQPVLLQTHLALWPAGTPEVWGRFQIPQFAPWQVLTYGFLHGGFTHLFFNLFALWMFGTQIENLWGARAFLFYYFICVVGAGLIQLVVVSTGIDSINQIYPTVGASGGVFGILLAYGMMFPNRIIMLLIPPIPLKAKYFVIGYGALELFFGVTGTQQGVAHFAHLGGMAFGYGVLRYWRSRAQRFR
ncbi:MAG: rhomboid family intramembrane serine protease [Pseudomonadota bacterium]